MDDCRLYLPAGHNVQVAAVSDVDPAGPYLPAAHTKPEHDADPDLPLYLPGGHDVQVAAAADVDPVGPYLPAAHSEPEHDGSLPVLLYFPATHHGGGGHDLSPQKLDPHEHLDLSQCADQKPLIHIELRYCTVQKPLMQSEDDSEHAHEASGSVLLAHPRYHSSWHSASDVQAQPWAVPTCAATRRTPTRQ
jgi:hypothetical protein